jgi:hypothetical protein
MMFNAVLRPATQNTVALKFSEKEDKIAAFGGDYPQVKIPLRLDSSFRSPEINGWMLPQDLTPLMLDYLFALKRSIMEAEMAMELYNEEQKRKVRDGQ